MPHTLLILTVGGSPEPIVASLRHWRPARVRFVTSPETTATVGTAIVPAAVAAGCALDPGRYEIAEVPDSQDLTACVARLRLLTPEVEAWLARGDDFEVVVDLTAGTKCMTAALVLQGQRWPCRFSYVGGTDRTKAGVGVVVTGTEKVLHTGNPWDALGFQAVDDAVLLFDRGSFTAAVGGLDQALRAQENAAMKRSLATLKSLIEAYAAWDRFDHAGALSRLRNLAGNANDLTALFGAERAGRILADVDRHRSHLQALGEPRAPSPALVLDLLGNARRRAAEGRHDDAVARLYRAIEATGQARLAERHALPDTGAVPLDRIPEPLRATWSARAGGGLVKIGLQDAFALLQALGDDVGARFFSQGLGEQRSPLTARNASILAHGFQPVGEKVFHRLWTDALALAGVSADDPPEFPRLGGPPSAP